MDIHDLVTQSGKYFRNTSPRLVFAASTVDLTKYQPKTLLRLYQNLQVGMPQDKWERMDVHVTEPESQDSLEADVAGDIRSFVAYTLANDEPVSTMLGDAAVRSEIIDTLTTRAHGK